MVFAAGASSARYVLSPVNITRHLKYDKARPEMEEAAQKVQEEVSQAYEEAERALELMRHEGETEELAAE